MKAHRATVRRFLRFVLGIEPPKLCVHQTLTFSPPVFDPPTAKSKLKRLLDNLHKRFQMGSFYVMEDREKGGLHFHVLFLFFPENAFPCAMSRIGIDFRGEIMRAWGNLQTGKLHPQANRTTIVGKIGSDYLLKGVEIVKPGDRKPATSTRWWDRWNAKLFAKHRVPVNAKAMKKALDSCLPVSPRPKRLRLPAFSNPDYGPADLERDKRLARHWVEALGVGETTPENAFEGFKRMLTARAGRNVSDEDFILFRQGQNPWRKKPRRDDSKANPS